MRLTPEHPVSNLASNTRCRLHHDYIPNAVYELLL